MAPASWRGQVRPLPRFTPAAAALISASARITRRGSRRPLTGKFSTARWVCAPQSAAGHRHLAQGVLLDPEAAGLAHAAESAPPGPVRKSAAPW